MLPFFIFYPSPQIRKKPFFILDCDFQPDDLADPQTHQSQTSVRIILFIHSHLNAFCCSLTNKPKYLTRHPLSLACQMRYTRFVRLLENVIYTLPSKSLRLPCIFYAHKFYIIYKRIPRTAKPREFFVYPSLDFHGINQISPKNINKYPKWR